MWLCRVIHYRLENFEHLRNVVWIEVLVIVYTLSNVNVASYKCWSPQVVEDKFQALMVDDGEIFRN